MASTISNKKFLNRKLPERSYLDFEYESADIPSYIRLPFFENVKISETRQSNLVTHSPIGRNSPLFSWIGAGARTMSLQFNFTLPLLIESALSLEQYRSIAEPDGIVFKGYGTRTNAYFPQVKKDEESEVKDIALIAANDYIEEIKKEGITQFLNKNRQLNNEELKELGKYVDENQDKKESIFSKVDSALAATFDIIPNALTDLANSFSADDPSILRKNQVIAIIMFWINVVRTSVLNNANNPKYGPPLIRLNHGIMYRDVPCVCQDYSIKFDDKAGFDLKTLLPRVITVTMKLAEVRVGDFSVFKAGDPIRKFNNVGWEVLLDNDIVQTIDPGKDNEL